MATICCCRPASNSFPSARVSPRLARSLRSSGRLIVMTSTDRFSPSAAIFTNQTSKQLSVETRKPIPAKPGRPARYDYEYERNGTANLFMMFAPLEGWRKVKVTDRHAALDYAPVLKELS